MTDTLTPDTGDTSAPPVYVPPTTGSDQSVTPENVSRETDSVEDLQARLNAAIAARNAAEQAPVNAPVDSDSESQAAVTVGTTPVGVAPVEIGPNGMPVAVAPTTVESLLNDAKWLKNEAKAAISELVKYSRMPEESRMRAVETALHALVEKVL